MRTQTRIKKPRALPDLTYVGAVPDLRWLLNFGRLDLDDFARLDLEAAKKEKKRPGALLDHLRSDLVLFAVGIGSDVRTETMSLGFLKQLQRDIREALQAMEDRSSWTLPSAPKHWVLEPPFDGSRSGNKPAHGPRVAFDGRPLRGAVLATFAEAVTQHWSQIKPCPDCGAFFFKVVRQIHCSPECLSDAFTPKRDYRIEYQRRRLAARRKKSHQWHKI